jgi:hypothetical protein
MIFSFLNDFFGSLVLLSIVFVAALVLEYRYNYIKNFIDQTNNFYNSMRSSIGLEGFENMDNNVFEISGISDNSVYSPGDAFSKSNEKLLSDFVPIQSENEAQSVWAKIPSQTCLKYDDGEKLKPLGNYFQRTNNYMRTHPDDCGAPFHEMIGTFYKPTDGVGKTAPSGLPLPGSVVSCNRAKDEVVGNTSIFTQSLTE